MDNLKSLRFLIQKPQAGYWGDEFRTVFRNRPVRVVRSGDAAGRRVLDERSLPVRWFSARELERSRCEPGDVVLVGSGDVGDAAVVPLTSSREPIAVSNFVRLIRARDGVDKSWLSHLLRWHPIKATALRVSGGTTLQNLSPTFFETRVAVPPLVEQRRIGDILDTVDDVVAASGRVAAKLLLHREAVLAGELRKLDGFRETTVASLAEHVVVGIVIRPTQYYSDSGVPILRSANVRASGLRMSDLVYMSEIDHRRNEKSRVQPGDLVTVRTGYPGTTAVIPDTLPTANCVDLVITRPRRELVLPGFLALWVNSERGRGQVLRAQAGLAQQHFNVGEMLAVRVPSVPLEIQGDLMGRVSVLDARIEAETATEGKLCAIRSALSTDLFTGRVRAVPE